MQSLRFTKLQFILSTPGVLFALIGISAFGEDDHIAVLMVLWGWFMTPVFWVYMEVLFRKNLNWKHRLFWFLIVLVVISLLRPVTPESATTQIEPKPELEGMVTEVTTTSEVLPSESALVAQGEEIVEANPSAGQIAQVMSVTDGDTLKVNLNGVIETIRVIGIDTPETVHPTEPVGCFGREASNKAKALLSGKQVIIVTDPSQGTRDKYERYLAYVLLESGLDFGEEMLRGGYGYEYTYAIPYEKQLAYKEAETYARDTGAGLWADGVCELAVEEVVVVPILTTPAVASSESCTIKGNISYSTGEKIYHIPGQENYTDTVIDTFKGESWFCTESEAVAAGWRKAKR